MGGCADTDIHSEKAEVDIPIQTCAKTLTKTHTQGRVNIIFFFFCRLQRFYAFTRLEALRQLDDEAFLMH